MRLTLPMTMLATVLTVMLVGLVTTADGVEQRRRPLYRRTSTTTGSPLSSDDSEGSESKYKPNGKDGLYTLSDSYPVSGGAGASPGSFKSDGDKLTSFSEYSFGSTKLSGGADGTLSDGGLVSDEESAYGSFKNHKKTSPLLPTTNAHNKERKPGGSPFDFLNGDYAKPKVAQSSSSHSLLSDTGLAAGGLGSKSKPSTISSKFSISHPTPSTVSKLAHLDDSTEYDVYATLGQSASKTKLGASKHRQSLAASPSYSSSSSIAGGPTSGGFDGKVKKVPFKYEDGGLGAVAGKGKKTKLSLDDDPYGTSHGSLGSASSPFPGLGSYETAYGGGRQQLQQQHQQGLGSLGSAGKGAGKFSFAEPPPLVKSTLNTLKHFGEGLIGNGNGGAGRSPYELAGGADSEETYHGDGGLGGPGGVKFGSYFGKGHFGAGAPSSPPVEESYESSGEPLLKGKFPKPLGAIGGGVLGAGGKFATDFDVKNIKLTDGGAFGVGGTGHKLLKNTTPHHKHAPQLVPHAHGHSLHNSHLHLGSSSSSSSSALPPQPHQHQHLQVQQQQAQQQQHQQQHHQQLQHQHAQQHAHHHAHATAGTISNPNPLDFRPNFRLQDVPNLYPAAHLGAGIAAKGQIESFLHSEQALKDESLVAQLLGDAGAAGRPHYHQFLKSQEDEKLEKEALRQQIEYLKAQAAKRPLDLNSPHRPAIVSNAQKFRPVRRIPSHVRLGVKAAYPLPRIPNYNDRPYSISFKI